MNDNKFIDMDAHAPLEYDTTVDYRAPWLSRPEKDKEVMLQNREWDDICPIPRDELPLVISVSGTLFTFYENDQQMDASAPVMCRSNIGQISEGGEQVKFQEALRLVNEKYLPMHKEKYPDKHKALRDAEIRTGS